MKKFLVLLVVILNVCLVETANSQVFKSLSNERLLVEVLINGKKSCALIDTGSSVSIINSKESKKFGFKKRNKYVAKIHTINGDYMDIYYTKNLDVRFLNQQVFQIITMDISDIKNSIYNETGIEISLILGLESIKKLGLIFNFNNDNIIITKKDAF